MKTDGEKAVGETVKRQALNTCDTLVIPHMPRLNESLQRLIDVAKEDDTDIIKCFRKNSEPNDVFLSIIAPYVGVKVTPSKEVVASIGLSEEFSIETAIETIRKAVPKPNTLYLLVNSPGGLVRSSYKVARALRKNFKKIIVFVPHIAASGGTLLALTGNEIVMGMMSQITPLDPQVGGISAQSVINGFENVNALFRKTSEEDATYSMKVLAEKYNAIQLEDAMSAILLMRKYIKDIVSDSGYSDEEIDYIAKKLTSQCLTHEEVIHLEEAQSIGLKAFPSTRYVEIWQAFRDLLGIYLLESADKHIIRYWIHNGKDKGDGKNGGGEKEKTKATKN